MDSSIVQHLNPLIHWIHSHPELAGIITFFIAFIESIAIIGLFVPGTVVMSAIGTLIGAGIIPVYETMFAAAIGAILGDFLSYKVGYHYTAHVKNTWPFKRYPQLLTHAQDFFERHGGKSIFLGRFVGPMRPIIPLIAGMMRMKQIRFAISCIIAGILWSPIYMLPGLLIGAASQRLAPETATRFIIVVLTLLILIWLTTWFFKWILKSFIRTIDKKMDAVWSYIKTHPHFHWIATMLQDPEHPQKHGQLTAVFIVTLLAILFILFLYSLAHGGFVTHLNQPIHQFFRNIQTIYGIKFMVIVSFLGYGMVLGAISLLVLLWLLIYRYNWTALHWFAIAFSIAIITELIKHTIHSPRPDNLQLIGESSNSFPSGHTTLSISLYGFLAFLIARNFKHAPQRHFIYWVFGTLCSLIMLSRLYLSAHWLTDIIGGIFIALIILFMTIISFRRIESPKLNLKGLISVCLIGIVITLPWQITHQYKKAQATYTSSWPTYSTTIEAWWHQQNNHTLLFRLNRVGRPVEIINLEWASNLDDIKQTLTAAGWQTIPRLTMIDLINRVAAHDNAKQYPIMEPLYLGQAPAYAAVKYSSQNHVMFIRLWASNFEFTDSHLPLWVGTITYQIPRGHDFWMHGKYMQKLSKLSSPTQELIRYLHHLYRYHLLKYPDNLRPANVPLYQWQGGVLLIMPTEVLSIENGKT